MRSAIGFLSLLAFGVLAAGVLMVISSGTSSDFSFDAVLGSGHTGGVHLGSLLMGLVLGAVLSALARVSWTELPRRFIGWMLTHERGFYRLVIAAAFVGVLVFY